MDAKNPNNPASRTLTLGHSADADDVFMWWPITGKVRPDGEPIDGDEGRPVIDTAGFRFRSVPDDIQKFNRRAMDAADLDITAISFHAYPHVRSRYALCASGSSMGEGYGPKVVAKADAPLHCENCLRNKKPTIAVPGVNTTAFLTLSLLLGPSTAGKFPSFSYVEMPFDRIMPAILEGRSAGRGVDAGLVIHEGQVTFKDLGLKQVVDVGQWWGKETGLPLPLGANAIKRSVDERFGAGTLVTIAGVLENSIRYALEHREEGLEYVLAWMEANGTLIPRERLEKYLDMYVTPLSVNMGARGRDAVRALLTRGHLAGLGPDPGDLDIVRVA
jgi:1,4-dihydroxy-6-naphthoate synthase